MLAIINTIVIGLLFLIWKRSDWANTIIKGIFLALLIANVVSLVKAGLV